MSLSTATGFAHSYWGEGEESPNLETDKALYMVGYSHLDTQWRWDYQTTIRYYIPATLYDNFALFKEFPGYIFNFTGSRRYRMMEEYYPEEFEQLREYVREGRWVPNGSSVDEADSVVPSPESLIRQILYGNLYFRQTFGTVSEDYMLPDCFGFPASLPSILAHCGLPGFSTQKLSWGSAVGIPFDVGVWEGTDGQAVIAALNPGAYTSQIREDLSKSARWIDALNRTGTFSGNYVGYGYFGVGDQGGAPDKESVQAVLNSVHSDGPLRVGSTVAVDLFEAVGGDRAAALPRYSGDLLLTEHSAGSITSQAYMKRWNRKNEFLADAAERAAVAANWAVGTPYPRSRFLEAWYLVLGSQMHDILPGTSIPRAYNFSWNDEVLALNQFADILVSSISKVATSLDTNVEGMPVVLYNPLSIPRNDPVEIEFASSVSFHRVFDGSGAEVPSQPLEPTSEGKHRLLFAPAVPPLSFTVFEVRAAEDQPAYSSKLSVAEQSLESERYRITLDGDGDIAQIYDKEAKRNLLAAPATLEILNESPQHFPAWNMDWDDRQQPPRATVKGPAQVRVVENGPVRVAVEITRQTEGSQFIQVLRLAQGAERIEVNNEIRWETRGASLKAAFPLAVSNPLATYNWDMGTVQRGNNHEKKYEVPSHHWFDLTHADGSYGVTILEDCKYGSDKPSDNTVRLTLLYTPDATSYTDQSTQDIGTHSFLYGIFGHPSSWQEAGSHWQGLRLNQPVQAFTVSKHEGSLGRSISLFTSDSDQVEVRGVKMAEESDEIILRLQELKGRPTGRVTISASAPIESAREMDGQERPIGPAVLADGKLQVEFGPYRPRTFAVRLSKLAEEATASPSAAVPLVWDRDVVSARKDHANGEFEEGASIPAEQFPESIVSGNMEFRLGGAEAGQSNALACAGQVLSLPEGTWNRFSVLAAATEPVSATFGFGGQKQTATVQDWTGFIGQWDNRIWDGDLFKSLEPAYIQRDPVAHWTSHRHLADGADDPYIYTYLRRYDFVLPPDCKSVTLPSDERILLFAAAVSDEPLAEPLAPLYDRFEPKLSAPRIAPVSGAPNQANKVSITPGLYSGSAAIHFTTDGSAPSAKAPVYETPLWIGEPTTIRAVALFPDGTASEEVQATLDVRDETPPQALAATYLPGGRVVSVKFDEPVSFAAGSEGTESAFESHTLKDGDTTLQLMLAKPWDAQESSQALRTATVTDRSASRNTLSLKAVAFEALEPVLTMEDFGGLKAQPFEGAEEQDTEHGAGWKFDGKKTLLQVDDHPSLNPTEQVTMAAWILSENWNGNRRIIQKGPDRGNYTLMVENGRFYFKLAGVGQVECDVPATGRWVHVAGTYDGQTMRVFFDGKQQAERPGKGEILPTPDPLFIGSKRHRVPEGDHFIGVIAAARIFDRALDEHQILDLLREN